MPIGTVLDLGCGPGRHAVPFAQRGFRVTGVDLSVFHLEKAKERASAAGVAVEFVEGDRVFGAPGARPNGAGAERLVVVSICRWTTS